MRSAEVVLIRGVQLSAGRCLVESVEVVAGTEAQTVDEPLTDRRPACVQGLQNETLDLARCVCDVRVWVRGHGVGDGEGREIATQPDELEEELWTRGGRVLGNDSRPNSVSRGWTWWRGRD